MRKNNEVTLSDILPPESKNELYPNEKSFEASNNENKSESRLAIASYKQGPKVCVKAIGYSVKISDQ